VEKILTASPESLVLGTLFILVMVVARLIKSKHWSGREQRISIFSDKQRDYIDERILHKFRSAETVLIDIRAGIKGIEKQLDELAGSYSKLERRFDLHEVIGDKDRS